MVDIVENKNPKTSKVLMALRETRSMSYRDLAAVVGKAASYVHRVETGVYDSPYAYINELAKKLHITKLEAKALREAWLEDQMAKLEF